MGHLGDIGDDDLTRNVASEHGSELALGVAELVGIDQLAHGNHADNLVRHLDADCRLTRDRRFDTHAVGGEVERDIVREVGDFADFDAGRRLQLIARDRRAAADVDDLGVDAEAVERIDQLAGILLQLLTRARVVGVLVEPEQLNRRIVIDLFFLLLRLREGVIALAVKFRGLGRLFRLFGRGSLLDGVGVGGQLALRAFFLRDIIRDMLHRGVGVVVIGTLRAVDDVDQIDAELKLRGVLLVGIGDVEHRVVGLRLNRRNRLDGFRRLDVLRLCFALLRRLVKRNVDQIIAASPASDRGRNRLAVGLSLLTFPFAFFTLLLRSCAAFLIALDIPLTLRPCPVHGTARGSCHVLDAEIREHENQHHKTNHREDHRHRAAAEEGERIAEQAAD